MQATEFLDDLVAGPQIEVISIGKDDGGVKVLPKIALGQAFDSRLGAYGHEDGRGNVAVRCVENTGARPCFRALGE
jgi:hypothetical protein